MAINNRPWRNKEYLYKKYVVDKMTIDQIADELTKNGTPVTSMTIYNNLKAFNLIRNSRNLGQRTYGPARKSTGGTSGGTARPKKKFY